LLHPVFSRRPRLQRQRGGAFEVRAHEVRRTLSVALEDRRGDGAVLADRRLEDVGGEDVGDLRCAPSAAAQLS